MRLSFILILSIVLNGACTEKPSKIENNLAKLPQVAYANTLIQKALKAKGLDLDIVFSRDSLNLGPESYRITDTGGRIFITGADANGLMYGGLEVAEQINLYEKVQEKSAEPYLPKRGIKFNIPLDARTPSYDDSGDAAQQNIAEMWSWDFWERFLDKMALYRYNTLSLWNPHPFPSMIKMEEYPDIALEDVAVTTLKPVGRENEWGDPQLVTRNVMENLKMVKKMTIEEKIDFWKKVMRHAKDRGISVYFITWNVCPNSVATPVEPFYKTFGINFKEPEKPGKYGITHQMDNPKTLEYHRKAVKQFFLTYPDLKGIGVTAGEHMPKEWDTVNREEWLWNSFGKGILDVKELAPNRKIDFIHRVWHSDMDQIMKYWKNYPDKFEVSFKYAKARLYSSPAPKFADSHITSMGKYGLKSWWNIRNDDIFVYRWGDPEYVRAFLQNFPGKEHTAAYHMGSDGYVWGKEFISKQAELSGQLEIDKHGYNFMLWGRLGYDVNLSEDFFIRKLQQKYPQVDAATLYKTWQTASKIIPLVNTFHWRDWDHHWSVEACLARPVLGGFREVSDFVDNPTMEGSNYLNPLKYAQASLAKEQNVQTGPLEVVKTLHAWASESLAGVATIQAQLSPSIELQAVLDDIKAMAFLGQYYAQKIEAATHLAFYQETKEKVHQGKAIQSLELAIGYWKKYTEISEKNYRPQMLARTYRLDWREILEFVKADVQVAREFGL